ncbi:Rrf2 family transcriptional regulator [Streptomyces sp. NPDC047046]|uniref:RrF2 family transcriptional regulator n=1 Tax=Streptomyces sp. NPDC047046 TaxID=3155378 RepID=UPI0033D16A8B
MRMSKGVEWAVHTLLNLAWADHGEPVSTARLAAGHDLPGPYLHKQLQALVRAGLLESVPGVRGGFLLARAPEAVSMLDIVLAIEGDEPLFRCTEIRQCGLIGTQCAGPDDFARPCAVKTALGRAEAAWREALAAQSLADVGRESAAHAPGFPGAVRRALGGD